MPAQNHLISSLKPSTVAVLGIPIDSNSSFMKGSAAGPAHLRKALHSGAMNLFTENGIDLENHAQFIDLGDMKFSSEAAFLEDIEQTVSDILALDTGVLSLGGDHSITYPIVKAYHKKHGAFSILHFDAHPDLYEEYEGNRFSHASPFARIMEDTLVTNLVQVGIRTINPHQRAQIERFGVNTIEMKEWYPEYPIEIDGPVYISLDLDALDPAFAPGVSHHEPGGFTTRDIIRMIQNLQVPIVGADIVELNPQRDVMDMTAMVGAKLLKELAGKMVER